ncbi:unnamed protein product, partial [Mesorhabditis spiculigera]
MKNTLACWAGNDFTCIGFERVTSMAVDKQNKTICTFAKCPAQGAIPCNTDCRTVSEVKKVLPDGKCEFRPQKWKVVFVAFAFIGGAALIVMSAFFFRAYAKARAKANDEENPSSRSSKRQHGDNGEKRPFLASKSSRMFSSGAQEE